jgi:hypothetical protein
MGFPGASFGRVGTLPAHCYEAGEGRDVPGATLRGGSGRALAPCLPCARSRRGTPEGIAKPGA